MGHREEALVGEKDMLLKQIEFRDQFIEVHKDYSPMKWFMQLFCLVWWHFKRQALSKWNMVVDPFNP